MGSFRMGSIFEVTDLDISTNVEMLTNFMLKFGAKVDKFGALFLINFRTRKLGEKSAKI